MKKTQRQIALDLYNQVMSSPNSALARQVMKNNEVDTLAFSRQLGLLNPNANFTSSERYLRDFKRQSKVVSEAVSLVSKSA